MTYNTQANCGKFPEEECETASGIECNQREDGNLQSHTGDVHFQLDKTRTEKTKKRKQGILCNTIRPVLPVIFPPIILAVDILY